MIVNTDKLRRVLLDGTPEERQHLLRDVRCTIDPLQCIEVTEMICLRFSQWINADKRRLRNINWRRIRKDRYPRE